MHLTRECGVVHWASAQGGLDHFRGEFEHIWTLHRLGIFQPFLPPQSGLLPYGTLIFVATCSIMWIYLYFFLPETKGKNIDEITSEFKAATDRIPGKHQVADM